MQIEPVDQAYLWDMWDAAKAIQDFIIRESFHHYQNDRKLRGAVERHLEIIGEAANRVSAATRAKFQTSLGTAL